MTLLVSVEIGLRVARHLPWLSVSSATLRREIKPSDRNPNQQSWTDYEERPERGLFGSGFINKPVIVTATVSRMTLAMRVFDGGQCR